MNASHFTPSSKVGKNIISHGVPEKMEENVKIKHLLKKKKTPAKDYNLFGSVALTNIVHKLVGANLF